MRGYWLHEELQRKIIGGSWAHWQETIARIRARFPLNRKTKVICPVTGEETDDSYGLSQRAWSLIAKGVEAEEKTDDTPRKWYAMSYFWLSFRYPRPDGTFAVTEGFHPAYMLFKLFDFQYRKMQLNQIPDDAVWLHSLDGMDLKPGDSIELIYMSERQAEAFKTFCEGIGKTQQANIQNALRIGNSWLTSMAKSEIGITDLDRLAGYVK